MALQKLLSYTESLEDPKHPLMGPTVKGLYLFGLWQTGSKLRTITYNCVHFSTFLFVICELVDLYNVRHDLNLVLNNMSLTVLSVICVTKCFAFVRNERKWRELILLVSEQELKQMKKRDETSIKIIREYTLYTRVVTYLFWVMVFMTNLLLIVAPFLKCISKSYRDDVASGKEPLPQILFSWFPFDNKKMPGYFFGIRKHHRMLNELLSPTMFLYVLLCSITICGSVVQFTSKEATTSQKIWVLEYTAGLVFQLFLYCWHSNEVEVETKVVDRGVYESTWWKGDTTMRRLALLLAGKLNNTLILDAGPYTTMSVPTFIEIIKGSYSFFTLFSQMQEN